MSAPVLAVHGGAGRRREDGAQTRAAERGLREALAAGHRVLADGGGAGEAVVVAVEVLEDCGALNAGRGSARTSEGGIEMDAAVMLGEDGRAGAVAGVSRIRHPVRAAWLVLCDGRHVLLAGAGAERFAQERGCEEVESAWFDAPLGAEPGPGTVGAVALDRSGHLAAATSTGGLARKLPGRVSDSCLVGAGTWADDATCAVSGTGHGEFFIRAAFAHQVDAAMRLAGLDLAAACERALARVAAAGGSGGCIAVDRQGRLCFPFDTPAMARGFVDAQGAIRVAPA